MTRLAIAILAACAITASGCASCEADRRADEFITWRDALVPRGDPSSFSFQHPRNPVFLGPDEQVVSAGAFLPEYDGAYGSTRLLVGATSIRLGGQRIWPVSSTGAPPKQPGDAFTEIVAGIGHSLQVANGSSSRWIDLFVAPDAPFWLAQVALHGAKAAGYTKARFVFRAPEYGTRPTAPSVDAELAELASRDAAAQVLALTALTARVFAPCPELARADTRPGCARDVDPAAARAVLEARRGLTLGFADWPLEDATTRLALIDPQHTLATRPFSEVAERVAAPGPAPVVEVQFPPAPTTGSR